MFAANRNSPQVPYFQDHKERLGSVCISLVIICTLSLQYYSSFAGGLLARHVPFLQNARTPNLWPFISYSLFTDPHYVGDKEHQQLLFGLLDHSTEVAIRAEDLGVCGWHFRMYFDSVLRDDLQITQKVISVWKRRHFQKLKGLRLANRPLIFTGNGMEEGPSETLKTVILPLPKDAL